MSINRNYKKWEVINLFILVISRIRQQSLF